MGWRQTIIKNNPNPTTGDAKYNKEHESCFSSDNMCVQHFSEFTDPGVDHTEGGKYDAPRSSWGRR